LTNDSPFAILLETVEEEWQKNRRYVPNAKAQAMLLERNQTENAIGFPVLYVTEANGNPIWNDGKDGRRNINE
jgi:hypothetical protein